MDVCRKCGSPARTDSSLCSACFMTDLRASMQSGTTTPTVGAVPASSAATTPASVDEQVVARIASMADGHALVLPPAAPIGRDADSASGDAEADAFVKRMGSLDESILRAQRRLRGAL
jgi:hypothetical protein